MQDVALIFILILLLLIFRSLLAPLITVIPALLAVTISGPLVGEAAHAGLKVSQLSQLLLIVLVLGRGDRLRPVPRLPRPGEPARRGGAEGRGAGGGDAGRGDHHLLRPHGDRRAAVPARRHLPDLLRARHPAGHRHRHHAAGRAHPAARAARGVRPGRVLAEQDQAGTGQGGRVGADRGAGRAQARRDAGHRRNRLGVLAIGVRIQARRVRRVHQRAGRNRLGGRARAAGQALPAQFGEPDQPGLQAAAAGVAEPAPVEAANSQLAASGLFTGVTGPLNPAGITLTPAQSTALHAALGNPAALPPRRPASIRCRADYQAYRATAQYVSPDGKTIQFETGLKAGIPRPPPR